MNSRIVNDMLEKAAQAEKDGDAEKAKHWLERAEKAEKIIERIRSRKSAS